MPVKEIEVKSKQPYAGGQSFGTIGPYQRLDGVLTFAVDPDNAANSPIVDLGLARRDKDSRVRFQSDFTLIVPQDPQKGNRRLVVDIVNRGLRRMIGHFNRTAPPTAGSPDLPAGEGFLFRLGYSVACIGWQWDVPRRAGLLGLEAPYALIAGKPIRGQAVVEIRLDVTERTRLLAHGAHKPCLVADLEERDARILVRDWEDGPDTEIPRDQWRFAREEGGRVVPSREHVYMVAGFQAGKVYHVLYTAEGASLVGVGLLAVRDAASFLRHPSETNPFARGFDMVFGYGVSQAGRLLRDFLHLALNLDEEGRMAYDGLIIHAAGARGGQFNHRFAQPANLNMAGFGHQFPFAVDPQIDPFSGRTEGLLDRARRLGGVPKVVFTNTAAEYWRGDASLLHTDPAGTRDLPSAMGCRVYHFAGVQHSAGSLPQTRAPGEGGRGRHPSHVVDYRPLLRAALVNLNRWVTNGTEPPPNKHPRLDDGTAVSRKAALDMLTMLPGLYKPDPERLGVIREVDLGPEADRGIGRYPVKEGRAYPCYVAALDADGNELGGIRLPDLEVPVGTHAGWNTRDPETGAPEQIVGQQGFTIFFAATAEARRASGDPRPSLEERYGSREAYLARVLEVAQKLAAQGYILDEDVEVIVQENGQRYDAAMALETGVAGVMSNG